MSAKGRAASGEVLVAVEFGRPGLFPLDSRCIAESGLAPVLQSRDHEDGGQERERRSGTLNVAGIVAMAVAARETDARRVAEVARVGTGAVVLSVPWEPVWRLGNLVRGRYVSDLGDTPGHIQHFGRGAFRRLVGRHLEVRAVRRPFPWTFVGAEVAGGPPR